MTYVSVTTTVDVDVDLADIDTDDLERELASRSIEIGRADESDVPKMFEALYIGDESRALGILRKFVQDATGRVLP